MWKQMTIPIPFVVILSVIAFCSSYFVSYADAPSFSFTNSSQKLDSSRQLQIGPFIIEHKATEDSNVPLPLNTHKNYASIAYYFQELTQELHSYGLQLPTVKVLLIDGTNTGFDACTYRSDKEILIYENNMDVRQVVAHEVGHVVDYLLMTHGKWMEYQKIRSFPTVDMYFEFRLPWAERPSEMFADDFASLFTGYSRFSETPPQFLKVKAFMVHLIQGESLRRKSGNMKP